MAVNTVVSSLMSYCVYFSVQFTHCSPGARLTKYLTIVLCYLTTYDSLTINLKLFC